MAKTKAFNLAELIRHMSYDEDSGAVVSTAAVNTSGRKRGNKTRTSTGTFTLHEFAKSDYSAAELTITAKSGSDYHTVKFLVNHDGSTTYDTQFGDVHSGDSSLSSFTSSISGANVLIQAAPTNASTTYKFHVEYVDA